MRHFIPLVAMSGLILFMIFIDLSPYLIIASAADASKTAKFLIDETLNSTIASLRQTFGNVTLLPIYSHSDIRSAWISDYIFSN